MKQSTNKILLLHSSNDMYGASRIVLQVIDILIKAKYEVHVILPYNGVLNKIITDKGASCSTYNLGVFRKKYLNLKGLYNRFLKIKKAKNHISNYIDKHHIDLLYTSTSVIISGGLAAKKRGIPNICTSTKYQAAINFTKYLLVCLCDIFQQKLLWFLIVLQNTGGLTLKKTNLLKFITVLFFRLQKPLQIQKEKLTKT
jgi:hypothetical protein